MAENSVKPNVAFDEDNDLVYLSTDKGISVIDLLDVNLSNQDAKEIPSNFVLFPNYPNPFNPLTNITYELSLSNYIRLSIYDIRGRRIAELINNFMPAGYHKIVWNGQNNASGLYFVKLEAGQYSAIQKVVLIK